MAVFPADWQIPLAYIPQRGRLVQLEILSDEHTAELLAISADPVIWRYLVSQCSSPEEFRAYLTQLQGDYLAGSALPLVVRTIAGGRVAGLTRLKNISRDHRKAVVGSWFAPAEWGTGVNTEAKLLLLEYAFESLGCLRLEFHADRRNVRSQSALTKMGATEEGILRSDLITKDGHRRDTVIFGVIDRDWPGIKRLLQARLQEQLGKGTTVK